MINFIIDRKQESISLCYCICILHVISQQNLTWQSLYVAITAKVYKLIGLVQ